MSTSPAPSLKPGFHRICIDQHVHQTWDVPMRYTQLSASGVDNIGKICSADDLQTGTKVLIKKLSRPFHSVEVAKRSFKLVQLLKHMNHENVVGLRDLFTPASTLEDFQDVYLAMPRMASDLRTVIRSTTFEDITDDHIQYLVYQIFRGLKYVHSAGIIHRDIKPSVIGIDENCDLKILEFPIYTMEELNFVVNRAHRAPEYTLRNHAAVSNSVDIWSVGCIMAELLTGQMLFYGTNFIDHISKVLSLVGTPDEEVLKKVASKEAQKYIKSKPVIEKKDFKTVFPGASSEAIDLLERTLDLDPDTRITAVDALAHPYLAQYADPTDEPDSEAYDQSFEEEELDLASWKELLFEEINSFVPRSPETTETSQSSSPSYPSEP